MSTNSRALESELRESLGEWATRHTISSMSAFLDLAWDSNMRFDEMDALDSAVVVDSKTNQRRAVVQRIRGELRYWLASSRDPIELTNSGQVEFGVVATIDDLARLCDEFLGGADIRKLQSAREILRTGGSSPTR